MFHPLTAAFEWWATLFCHFHIGYRTVLRKDSLWSGNVIISSNYLLPCFFCRSAEPDGIMAELFSASLSCKYSDWWWNLFIVAWMSLAYPFLWPRGELLHGHLVYLQTLQGHSLAYYKLPIGMLSAWQKSRVSSGYLPWFATNFCSQWEVRMMSFRRYLRKTCHYWVQRFRWI